MKKKGVLRQSGAAIVETVVALPLLMLIGLGLLQYILLFNAKNAINYALFEASRAGSMANADMTEMVDVYTRALVPLYGGGVSQADLNKSLAKAKDDVKRYARVELLNPTRESFDDWNSLALQQKYRTQKRVIPNSWQELKNREDIGVSSGQNIQDANLLKIRVVHGYEPKIPFVATVFKKYLQWLDTRDDPYRSELIDAGRIPVQSIAIVHMMTDAIEPETTVSEPGTGNQGKPVDPGDPPITNKPPPDCVTMGCTVINGGEDGPDGKGGGGGGGNGKGTCTDLDDEANASPTEETV